MYGGHWTETLDVPCFILTGGNIVLFDFFYNAAKPLMPLLPMFCT